LFERSETVAALSVRVGEKDGAGLAQTAAQPPGDGVVGVTGGVVGGGELAVVGVLVVVVVGGFVVGVLVVVVVGRFVVGVLVVGVVGAFVVFASVVVVALVVDAGPVIVVVRDVAVVVAALVAVRVVVVVGGRRRRFVTATRDSFADLMKNVASCRWSPATLRTTAAAAGLWKLTA
jgi:hypothetical protein